jgi:hypothetical protein
MAKFEINEYYEVYDEPLDVFQEPAHYDSDHDEPVNLMIKNISKDKLSNILSFLDSEKLKFTSYCEEVDFNDDNDYYFRKYLHHLIRTNTSLPKSLKPHINNAIICMKDHIESIGENKHYNNFLLKKAESMIYH